MLTRVTVGPSGLGKTFALRSGWANNMGTAGDTRVGDAQVNAVPRQASLDVLRQVLTRKVRATAELCAHGSDPVCIRK